MNYKVILNRPLLWLPGIAIVFSIFACSKLYLENTLPSSVGSVILRGMTFVISGLSVSVAWDAARFHEIAKIFNQRSQLFKLIMWIFIPCWLWNIAAFLSLWGYQILAFNTMVYPHPMTFLLAIVMGTIWPILGMVFVWVFPHIFGLLMAVILPFTVTSFAWTFSDYRWRHMFGVPSFCCGLSSTLNTDMVVASVLCLSGMAIVGVSLVLFKRTIPVLRITRVVSSSIIILGIGGIIGSSVIAKSLENYAATQPRNIGESVCRESMCFWPENTTAQIEANKAAYIQIRATMPTRWLPTTDPVVSPDPNFRIGAIDKSLLILGEKGSPLPFVDSVDPKLVYDRFATVLVSRQLGSLMPLIGADKWQDWANRQTKPASPEEVWSWLDSEVKQMGLIGIRPNESH